MWVRLAVRIRLQPDRAVVRKRTSFELTAGEQNAGAVRQVDRIRAEVDEADEVLAACEGEDGFGRREPPQVAVTEGRDGPAKAEARAVKVEHRRGVLGLRLDGERRPVVGLVEPRTAGPVVAEAERRPLSRPRKRDAAAVATRIDPAGAVPHRVLAPVGR